MMENIGCICKRGIITSRSKNEIRQRIPFPNQLFSTLSVVRLCPLIGESDSCKVLGTLNSDIDSKVWWNTLL